MNKKVLFIRHQIIMAFINKIGSFVAALYDGILGSREDGAYPGRAGKDTIFKIKK